LDAADLFLLLKRSWAPIRCIKPRGKSTMTICFATTEKIKFAGLYSGWLKRLEIQEYMDE